jgi:hypothetical protein
MHCSDRVHNCDLREGPQCEKSIIDHICVENPIISTSLEFDAQRSYSSKKTSCC